MTRPRAYRAGTRAHLSPVSAITPNPFVFVGAATVMVVVALAATFLPAWRATQVDPLVALRSD